MYSNVMYMGGVCVCVPDTEAEESRSLSDDHQAGVMGITHAQ